MTIAIDGTAGATGTNTSSISATLTTANAGDVIVAFITNTGSTHSSSPSSLSGAGIVWNTAPRASGALYHGYWEVWYGYAAAALVSVSITATLSHSTEGASMEVCGISGAAGPMVVDPSAGFPIAFNEPATSPTVYYPVNVAGSMVLYFAPNSNQNNSAPSGFSAIGYANVAGSNYYATTAAFYDVVASASPMNTMSPTVSTLGAAGEGIFMDALLPAGASVPIAPPFFDQGLGFWYASAGVNNATTKTFSSWTNNFQNNVQPQTTYSTKGLLCFACSYTNDSGANNQMTAVTLSGYTFTRVGRIFDSASSQAVELWTAPYTTAASFSGSIVVTWANISGSGNVDDAFCNLFAITGLGSTSGLDTVSGNPFTAANSGNTAPPALSFSSKQTQDLAIGFTCNTSRTTPSGVTGWVNPIAWGYNWTNNTPCGIMMNANAYTSAQSNDTYQDGSVSTSNSWMEFVVMFTGNPTAPPGVITVSISQG